MKTHLDMSGIVELEKKLAALESKQVDWGYVNGGIHSKAGIPYANLAMLLEYGGFNIPSRPAFRDSIERLKSNHTAFEFFVQPEVNKYLLSKSQNPHNILKVSGEYLSDRYKGSMEDWVLNGSQNRSNARTTTDLKGFNQPFVETGELISHVDYRIH